MRDELRRKRRVKRRVHDERRGRLRGHAPTPADLIPVTTHDTAPHVHHLPEEDVRAVLRLLPPGVTDGLAGIELRLGRTELGDQARANGGGDTPDPFTGHPGAEWFPGVWHAPVLGCYRGSVATIEVNAYLHDPAHPRRGVWEILVRRAALSTLLHEVGHHHDRTCRVARGRWTATPGDNAERYAESRDHRWTREIVLPYLRRRYPRQVRRLERWVERHAGVRIPFEEMVDDPRITGPGGSINVERFSQSLRHGIAGLVADVDTGREPRVRRTNLARELHYGAHYDRALEVLAAVLARHPGDPEALLLRADILVHQQRWTEALEVARALLHAGTDSADVHEVIVDALEGLERWSEMEEAATRLVAACESEGPAWCLELALAQRGRARLRQGDADGARADAARVRSRGTASSARRAQRLEDEIDRAPR